MLSRSAIRTAARSVVATNTARALNRVVSIFMSLIVRGVEDFDVHGDEGGVDKENLGCTIQLQQQKQSFQQGGP